MDLKKIKYQIKDVDIEGFYIPVNVKISDNGILFLDDAEFQSKTMSFMLKDLKFVYAYFFYMKQPNTAHYDILHGSELNLVKELHIKKERYSIFKPGLIFDWKDEQIDKFVDFLNSKNPLFEINIDDVSHKVTPEYSSFGVVFESTLNHISCKFCDFLECSYRRSDLDKKLIDKIYLRENSNGSKS